VHGVIIQIREEIKPLAKLDGRSRSFCLKPVVISIAYQCKNRPSTPSTGILEAYIYILDPEILGVAKGVMETLVEFQTQVVHALRK